MKKQIHVGRNVKRFREMLGIKQKTLSSEMGHNWSQKKISLLEQKETIDAPILQQISTALKIPAEAFKYFDEENAVKIIVNNCTSQDIKDNCISASYNMLATPGNSIEKLIELYERMIQMQKEIIEKFEKWMMDKV